MFGDGLPRHVHLLAKLAQDLSVPRVKAVEKLPTAWIGKRPENRVHAHGPNMQLNGCMSRAASCVRGPSAPRMCQSEESPRWPFRTFLREQRAPLALSLSTVPPRSMR